MEMVGPLGRGGRVEGRRDAVLGWTAIATGAGAVLAWAACCVLPMALATAGLSLGATVWLATQRSWLTVLALVAFALTAFVTWRRSRRARTDASCAPPSRLSTVLLVASGFLVLLALAWQPLIEPPMLALIRSWRG